MIKAKLFYPLFAIIITIGAIIFIAMLKDWSYALYCTNFVKELSLGFITSFIFSVAVDDSKTLDILKYIKYIQYDNSNRASFTGALKKGKVWTILLAALINFAQTIIDILNQ